MHIGNGLAGTPLWDFARITFKAGSSLQIATLPSRNLGTKAARSQILALNSTAESGAEMGQTIDHVGEKWVKDKKIGLEWGKQYGPCGRKVGKR